MMNMRDSPRRKFVNLSSENLLKNVTPVSLSPAIIVGSALSTPSSSRRGSLNTDLSAKSNGFSSVANLSLASRSNFRRHRRKTSASRELMEERQRAEEDKRKKYFQKDFPPIENFKKAVRLVQILMAISEIGYQNKESDELNLEKYFTFTEYADKEEVEHIRSGLSFDTKLFKANKEMRLTAEIKAILTKSPHERSNQQLAKVQYSLRSIQSFAEYPVRMQKKLVRVGWYERHTSKRVILRQGHPPQAFYFVLSGSAVVKVVDRQQNVARTICFLKRGDSFGELALLHDTRRQSTVISRELIELLCISKEDFIDIFMAAGGVKNINDPDHAEFISSLEFLQGWPTEELPRNPKKFLFHFFRRGAVLVRDSNHSDWLYVVKSGSCQVLKKLKKVQSQVKQNSKLRDASDGKGSELSAEKLHDYAVNMARKKRYEILDPHISAIQAVATAQRDERLNDPHKTLTLHGIRSSSSDRTKKDVTFKDQEQDDGPENIKLRIKNDLRNIDHFRSAGPIRRRASEQELDERRRARDDMDIRMQEKSRNRYGTFDGNIPGGELAIEAAKQAYTMSLKRQRSRSDHFYLQTPTTTSQSRRALESPQHKLAIIDEAAKKHEQTVQQITEADMDPCFVQVAVLQKGDVFGLHSIFCDNQPSLSLVSNGAECIMVLKKFYLEHCSERLKGRLRKRISPYPDDIELQNSLQEKVNWDHYKSQALREALRNIRTINRIRDNSVV